MSLDAHEKSFGDWVDSQRGAAHLEEPGAELAATVPTQKALSEWHDVKEFVEPATNSAWNDFAPNRKPSWGRTLSEEVAFHIAATAAERACKAALRQRAAISVSDGGGSDASGASSDNQLRSMLEDLAEQWSLKSRDWRLNGHISNTYGICAEAIETLLAPPSSSSANAQGLMA